MAITRFIKEYQFLSNFWLTEVEFEGMLYMSVEHAFQAAKTIDPEERKDVQAATTPGRAKKVGKRLTLREGWDSMKLDVMYFLLQQKFGAQNPGLQELLSVTEGQEIIEGNLWHDTYWGVCYGSSVTNCTCTPDNPQGENHLGQLLMTVREENKMNEKCIATTNSGNPCKNAPQKDEQMCGPHLTRAYKEMEMDTLHDNPALEIMHQVAEEANPEYVFVAVVGHRPDKLGGYKANTRHLEDEVERVFEKIQELHPNATIVDLCGGAQGADWIGARVAKRTNRPYKLYKPFEGQEKIWPLAAQKKYAKLEEHADKPIVVVSEVDRKNKKQVIEALYERNRKMIDDAHYVIAIWNGDDKGGTAHAVGYAEEKGKTRILVGIDSEGQLTRTVIRK